jgi:hypothetical protein
VEHQNATVFQTELSQSLLHQVAIVHLLQFLLTLVICHLLDYFFRRHCISFSVLGDRPTAVTSHIPSDAVQPSGELPSMAELAQTLPRPQEYFLHQIVNTLSPTQLVEH